MASLPSNLISSIVSFWMCSKTQCRRRKFPSRSFDPPSRCQEPSETHLCSPRVQRATSPISNYPCLPSAMGWGNYQKLPRPANNNTGGNGSKGYGKDSKDAWAWSVLQEQREANRRYAEREQQREAEEQRESLLAEVAHTTKNTVKQILGMGRGSKKVKKDTKHKKENNDRAPSFGWTRMLERSLKRNVSSSSSIPASASSSSSSSSSSWSAAGFMKKAMKSFGKKMRKEKDRRKKRRPARQAARWSAGEAAQVVARRPWPAQGPPESSRPERRCRRQCPGVDGRPEASQGAGIPARLRPRHWEEEDPRGDQEVAVRPGWLGSQVR